MSKEPSGIAAQAVAPSNDRRRFWLLHRRACSVWTSNVAGLFCVEGPLPAEPVKQAVQALADRHDGLRMGLHDHGGQLVAMVSEPSMLPALDVDRVAVLPDEDVAAPAEEPGSRPFNLCCPAAIHAPDRMRARG